MGHGFQWTRAMLIHSPGLLRTGSNNHELTVYRFVDQYPPFKVNLWFPHVKNRSANLKISVKRWKLLIYLSSVSHEENGIQQTWNGENIRFSHHDAGIVPPMKRGKISKDFLKTCEDDKIGEFCSTGTCDFTMNYGDETAINSRSASWLHSTSVFS